MHLVGVVLAVLGAWTILAVPVALLVGRFLRVGTDPTVTAARSVHHDSFGTAA